MLNKGGKPTEITGGTNYHDFAQQDWVMGIYDGLKPCTVNGKETECGWIVARVNGEITRVSLPAHGSLNHKLSKVAIGNTIFIEQQPEKVKTEKGMAFDYKVLDYGNQSKSI